MFYYPEQVIRKEFGEYDEQDEGLNGSDSEDEYHSSNIFDISQSYFYNQVENAANLQLNPDHQEGDEHNLNVQNRQNLPNNMDENAEVSESNEQIDQEMIRANHLGYVYIFLNKQLANIFDPLMLLGFFLAGYLSSPWGNMYACIGICMMISSSLNTALLILKGWDNCFFLQKMMNNIFYVAALCLWFANGMHIDDQYQRYILLTFVSERLGMYLIHFFRWNPRVMRKLLLYGIVSWPVYKQEFDEHIAYNFDFANQLQSCFSRDAVQNYLKFMIYTYELILVLQILAYSWSQPSDPSPLQQYSFFFAAVYYLSILYFIIFNYYFAVHHIHLPHIISHAKEHLFIIMYFFSYGIFIILQLIHAIQSPKYSKYYILQFEPIFSLYTVCIAMRLILNRLTRRSLLDQILKHAPQQQQQPQQIPNPVRRFLCTGWVREELSSILSNFFFNTDIIGIFVSQNKILSLSPQILQYIFEIKKEVQQSQYFVEIRRNIQKMLIENKGWFDKQANLIVNYEGYSLTIVLALMLFLYMFADNAEIYLQNGFACNIYYFLSIVSFMFYFLASKKLSLAYEKLKVNSEPISVYWIIPFQYYLNKVGWSLTWIQCSILIYLYTSIDFSDNQFIKAEYLFMIFFALFTFLTFTAIHALRKHCSSFFSL